MRKTFIYVGVVMMVGCVNAATLCELLEAAKPPLFKAGHTLPRLSRWGWSMPFEVRVKLCEEWGYGLEVGGYLTEGAVDEIERDAAHPNAKVVALAAANPERYPLTVLAHRPLGRDEIPAKLLKNYYVRDKSGELIDDGGNTWRLISPEAPASIFKWAAAGTVGPLRRLQKMAPIAVVLNGGEYGLSVYGHSGRFWEQDPRVVRAKGKMSWYDYISKSKARQERIISDAVRKAVPGALYVWYHFGGEPTWSHWSWANNYAYTRVLSDYPGQSIYYAHYNSGWSGKNDLLSNYLIATSQAIEKYREPLSYNWVAGGWTTNATSTIERYTGFLKCLYTGGMIGGGAGDFSAPPGHKGEDIGDKGSPCLDQMMALGHVHGLFSHLEDFLRQGELLPGPLVHDNVNAEGLPRYELPSGDPTVRVLARRHLQKEAWLVTVWAAEGAKRDVTLEIPALGSATLTARPEGSVYILRGEIVIKHEPPSIKNVLVDINGMDPSRSAGSVGNM